MELFYLLAVGAEIMNQIHEENANTDVIIRKNKVVKLKRIASVLLGLKNSLRNIQIPVTT